MAGSPPVRAGGETTLPQRFLRTGELLLCEMCTRNHRSELGGSHISREVIESGTVYEPITVVVSRFGINYKQSLGTTDRLTVARLEEVAGMLQARLI